MSSEDSDVEAVQVSGYTPALAASIRATGQAPRLAEEQWPQGGGVHTYNNSLYKSDIGDIRPVSAGQRANMQAQKSMQAQRRAERMQGGMYTSNEGGIYGRSASSRPLQVPGERSQLPSTEAARRAPGDSVYGLKSSFDPNEGANAAAAEQQRVLNNYKPATSMSLRSPGPGANSHRLAAAAIPSIAEAKDVRSFLMAPGPKAHPISCYIIREKMGSAVSALKGGKSNVKYSLYLEEGKRFLMAARKRGKKTTSNYVVSLDHDDLKRDSETFFGNLRSNFVGSEFTIYDAGNKPEKKRGKKKDEEEDDEDHEDEDCMERQQLGCVSYQYNVLGTRGPRKMTAAIPLVGPNGLSVFHPSSPGDSILERVKKSSGVNALNLVVMHNKTPRWNEELNAYCLNFHGRVTEASVKNFQLVTDDDPNYVILQFGKTGKHSFTMDYQYPMSALQAFCICLSSFDNKLACE